jgi:hypothetical protein
MFTPELAGGTTPRHEQGADGDEHAEEDFRKACRNALLKIQGK